MLLGSEDVLCRHHDFGDFRKWLRCCFVCAGLGANHELFALQTDDVFSIFYGEIVGVCVILAAFVHVLCERVRLRLYMPPAQYPG